MTIINELIESLSKIPGLGKKSAARIAIFLINHKDISLEISDKIKELISKIKICTICNNYTINNDTCEICQSATRDDSLICIVEDIRDLQAVEDTGLFNGKYHVLMGNINPLAGIGPDQLKINELIKRINTKQIKEILIATNTTTEGEATFLYLTQILSDYPVKISRLATGIPMGGSLEYSDKLTLIKAFQSKYYIK